MSTSTISKKSAASKTTPNKAESRQIRPNKTKFWVVCCEETEVTRQISEAVTAWQLPEVRALSTESFLTRPISSQQPRPETITEEITEAVAEADYAIFITSYEQHGSQIKISPLSPDQLENPMPETPGALLSAIQDLHGQSPHSWWLQLPTVEVRAQRVQPVSAQESVAQALNQIGIFVRNYQLAMPYGEDGAIAPAAINSLPKASASQTVSPPKPVVKPVVLTHYRRI